MKINGLSRWFTNLDIQRNVKPLNLCKTFNQDEYPLYDNYDAFNVNKVADIPVDTSFKLIVTDEQYRRLCNTYGNDCKLLEIMKGGTIRVRIENPILGVPITFLDKYNPDQFNILGLGNATIVVKGKPVYKRIFIQHK